MLSLRCRWTGVVEKRNSEPLTYALFISSSESMYRSLKVVIKSLRGSLGVVMNQMQNPTSGTTHPYPELLPCHHVSTAFQTTEELGSLFGRHLYNRYL